MKKVNVFEVKAKLSEYLELVEKGERVLICRRNHPVAELRAVAAARTTERPVGGSQIDLSPAFFEPLPADMEDAFYGSPAPARGVSALAERPAHTYGGASKTRPRTKKR